MEFPCGKTCSNSDGKFRFGCAWMPEYLDVPDLTQFPLIEMKKITKGGAKVEFELLKALLKVVEIGARKFGCVFLVHTVNLHKKSWI